MPLDENPEREDEYPSAAPTDPAEAIPIALEGLNKFLNQYFPLQTKWQVPPLPESIEGNEFSLEFTGEPGDTTKATVRFALINGGFGDEVKGYWFALTARVEIDMQVNPQAPASKVGVIYGYSAANGEFWAAAPIDEAHIDLPPARLRPHMFMNPGYCPGSFCD